MLSEPAEIQMPFSVAHIETETSYGVFIALSDTNAFSSAKSSPAFAGTCVSDYAQVSSDDCVKVSDCSWQEDEIKVRQSDACEPGVWADLGSHC